MDDTGISSREIKGISTYSSVKNMSSWQFRLTIVGKAQLKHVGFDLDSFISRKNNIFRSGNFSNLEPQFLKNISFKGNNDISF